MPEFNPSPSPPRGDVHVTVPASVLYDLEGFQRAQAAVLGELGCRGCTSGWNFIWHFYTDYAVSQAGEVRPVLAGAPGTQE